jgi:hypothetical protein
MRGAWASTQVEGKHEYNFSHAMIAERYRVAWSSGLAAGQVYVMMPKCLRFCSAMHAPLQFRPVKIAAAQRARWAKVKAQQKKAA